MHSYKRSERVAELLQQEISRIVQELKDKEPELGFVTITGIKLSDDLRSCRIYYSVIGSPEEVERSGKIIMSHRAEIRHEIARRVNLRYTPELAFEFDSTPERATRIFSLLEKIRHEQEEPREEPKEPEPEPRKGKKKKGSA